MTPNMQITDADLQTLLTQNPLAAEQLRRIMAERQRDELIAALHEMKNGDYTEEIITDSVDAG